MPSKKIGVCKLTGETGQFVKSHIIPRALTLPRTSGQGFAEIGQGARPTRRFDSWYDLELVTQSGEDILTRYDTFAISEMRRLKLIWQSWGPMQSLAARDLKPFGSSPNGVRQVKFHDPATMRLFFLSLLWRAAESKRSEFAEIRLSASQRRKLRKAVRDKDVNLPDPFYPITLTQIVTRGPPHNHGPISEIKMPVNIGKVKSKPIKVFRFYFDGLAIHIHPNVDPAAIEGMAPMLVGPQSYTTLSTVTWKDSWQAQNLAEVIADAESQFPGAISRADGQR